jgi:hypothetical protein
MRVSNGEKLKRLYTIFIKILEMSMLFKKKATGWLWDVILSVRPTNKNQDSKKNVAWISRWNDKFIWIFSLKNLSIIYSFIQSNPVYIYIINY